ncbi:MAG: acyl-CoA carboxylase subunit beta [Dehalococcoidia bacterium]|nr:acyl-CoA carboxylase subunit beta [Dehalococcoidia bacterium]MDD5494901.1 acyl-CoA carboxylase subunit beta [Dehalococcoidia bacterium]
MTSSESNMLTKSHDKLDELIKLKDQQLAGGGSDRVRSQHAKGKLTARERIELLLEPGTFEELDAFVLHNCTHFKMSEQRYLGDAVITGYGMVNGRQTFVFAQDFTVFGGSLSVASAEKICKLMDLAAKVGAPVIGLLDSGGARIQEGVDSLAGCGEVFSRNTLYSGVIPQISVIMGPCAGAAVYSPALTDFIFMVKGIGQMYITGPNVIKSVTGEEVTFEELGAAEIHAAKSGNCHFVAEDERECLKKVRRLLSYLPQNNREKPASIDRDGMEEPDEEMLDIVPADPNKPYDMRQVIHRITDEGDFMEVHADFGKSMITGFARLGGMSVGIVAQQPAYFAGAINVDSADKGARFVRFCDCFNIPLVTLVDVPGYMPSVEQEYQGIIRHGAKLLFAYSEATVPKISLILRKAYGGAYVAMGSKSLRGDINYAWPNAEIAVMGPLGAINILYRSAVEKSDDPAGTRRRLVEEYTEEFANPYIAASSGHLDDVIDPRLTRSRLIKALKLLENKADTVPYKKHGNIPL